jgi:hypothetical protein
MAGEEAKLLSQLRWRRGAEKGGGGRQQGRTIVGADGGEGRTAAARGGQDKRDL